MKNYSNTLGYRIKQLQVTLRQRMDEVLAADGLATPQFAVLSALREDSNQTNAELARSCFVTPQTMHRITTRLVAEDLLVVSVDPLNAKKRRLSLTKVAKSVHKIADKKVRAVEACMIDGLDPEEIQLVGQQLDECRRRLEQ